MAGAASTETAVVRRVMTATVMTATVMTAMAMTAMARAGRYRAEGTGLARAGAEPAKAGTAAHQDPDHEQGRVADGWTRQRRRHEHHR